MPDDPIRALLASLPPAGVPRAPGYVAVLRSRVEEAGGDPQVVAEWVEKHGGYLDRTDPMIRRGLGPNYGKKIPGEDFYAVPRDALGI